MDNNKHHHGLSAATSAAQSFGPGSKWNNTSTNNVSAHNKQQQTTVNKHPPHHNIDMRNIDDTDEDDEEEAATTISSSSTFDDEEESLTAVANASRETTPSPQPTTTSYTVNNDDDDDDDDDDDEINTASPAPSTTPVLLVAATDHNDEEENEEDEDEPANNKFGLDKVIEETEYDDESNDDEATSSSVQSKPNEAVDETAAEYSDMAVSQRYVPGNDGDDDEPQTHADAITIVDQAGHRRTITMAQYEGMAEDERDQYIVLAGDDDNEDENEANEQRLVINTNETVVAPSEQKAEIDARHEAAAAQNVPSSLGTLCKAALSTPSNALPHQNNKNEENDDEHEDDVFRVTTQSLHKSSQATAKTAPTASFNSSMSSDSGKPPTPPPMINFLPIGVNVTHNMWADASHRSTKQQQQQTTKGSRVRNALEQLSMLNSADDEDLDGNDTETSGSENNSAASRTSPATMLVQAQHQHTSDTNRTKQGNTTSSIKTKPQALNLLQQQLTATTAAKQSTKQQQASLPPISPKIANGTVFSRKQAYQRQETPIEQEIRLAKEREEQHRFEHGLAALPPSGTILQNQPTPATPGTKLQPTPTKTLLENPPHDAIASQAAVPTNGNKHRPPVGEVYNSARLTTTATTASIASAYSNPPASPSSSVSSSNNNNNYNNGEQHHDAQRQLATSRIRREIEEQQAREDELRVQHIHPSPQSTETDSTNKRAQSTSTNEQQHFLVNGSVSAARTTEQTPASSRSQSSTENNNKKHLYVPPDASCISSQREQPESIAPSVGVREAARSFESKNIIVNGAYGSSKKSNVKQQQRKFSSGNASGNSSCSSSTSMSSSTTSSTPPPVTILGNRQLCSPKSSSSTFNGMQLSRQLSGSAALAAAINRGTYLDGGGARAAAAVTGGAGTKKHNTTQTLIEQELVELQQREDELRRERGLPPIYNINGGNNEQVLNDEDEQSVPNGVRCSPPGVDVSHTARNGLHEGGSFINSSSVAPSRALFRHHQ